MDNSKFKIDILNIEPMQSIIKICCELLKDERMSDECRNEYINKIDAILHGIGYVDIDDFEDIKRKG